MPGITCHNGDASVARVSIASPSAENIIPPTVNRRQPNLSDNVPLTDPKIAIPNAPGITASPAAFGLRPSTFCR